MGRPAPVRVEVAGLAPTALARVDYADAFEVAVDPALPADPDWWRRRLFTDPPWWAAAALRARNLAMRPFGLTGGRMTDVPVVAADAEELVIGLDDAHLDFRLGIRVHDARLRLTTTVRFHGLAGRAYFLPVRPVHAHVVVPGMLRRAARARG